MSIGYLFSSIGVSRIMTIKMEFIAGHLWQKYISLLGVAFRQHPKFWYIKYLFNHFFLHLVC